MTKKEILDLIHSKVSGQGNQVDLGSALPIILSSLLDLIGVEDTRIGDLATLETDHKSTLVEAINEVFDVVETEEMVISMMQSSAERKAIYDECILHPHIAKNIVFYNISDGYYYRVNGYKTNNNVLFLHTIMIDGQGVRSVAVQLASNGSLAVA